MLVIPTITKEFHGALKLCAKCPPKTDRKISTRAWTPRWLPALLSPCSPMLCSLPCLAFSPSGSWLEASGHFSPISPSTHSGTTKFNLVSIFKTQQERAGVADLPFYAASHNPPGTSTFQDLNSSETAEQIKHERGSGGDGPNPSKALHGSSSIKDLEGTRRTFRPRPARPHAPSLPCYWHSSICKIPAGDADHEDNTGARHVILLILVIFPYHETIMSGKWNNGRLPFLARQHRSCGHASQ